jgi:predicted Rossmann fold nucleotide-binding protein DprA/Smf involved in DNA uptake
MKLDNNILTLLRLHTAQGIGQRTITKMRQWSAETGGSLESVFDLSPENARRLFGLKQAALEGLAKANSTTAIDAAKTHLDQLMALNCRIILRGNVDYPLSLETHLNDDAPPILYITGNMDALGLPGVAFSGARNASEAGIMYTAALARQAVEQKLAVICGHAPGIDAAAHAATLDSGGVTVLVIPEGVFKFRLRAELKALYEKAPDHLVVVSEFPPTLPWSTQNAMIRNRTILGLAQAAMIIEAGETGGTWDAGLRALDMKLPLYVLDYSDPPPSAAGNRALILRGGRPLTVMPQPVLPRISRDAPTDSPKTPTQLSLF